MIVVGLFCNTSQLPTFPQTMLELAQQYQHYTMLPDPPYKVSQATVYLRSE